MARKKTEKIVRGKEDWRHLAWVGGMLGCVLLTLSLGASMAVDDTDDSTVAHLQQAPGQQEEQAEAALPSDWVKDEDQEAVTTVEDLIEEPIAEDRLAAAPPKPSPVVPMEEARNEVSSVPARSRPAAPEMLPARDRLRDSLQERVDQDRQRLARTPDRWTLQFLVTREAAKAQTLLGHLEGDADLHILPVRVKGVDCYRICWGSFPTREAAEAASVPASLTDLNDSPMPRSVRGLSG